MKRASILALVTLASACASTKPTAPTAPAAELPSSSQPTPQNQTPGQSASVTPPSTKATGDFALDMYGQLAQQPSNFAFSPTSIELALAMTYAGARGSTAQQMRRALSFGDDDAALHAIHAARLAAWNDPTRDTYELSVVNRLFGDTSAQFVPDFVQLTRDHYGAPVEALDFRGASDASRQHINAFVAKHTKDRITNLLPPGSIKSTTRLVLTNALYFKGTWKHEFDAEATVDADFRTLANARVRVPMMNMTRSLRYAEVDGVQVVELPYEGGDLAMNILLPKDADGLAGLETKMVAGELEAWLGALRSNEVILSLPRFKLDPSAPISLATPLQELGMREAFDPSQADFSGMSDEDLFVDNVFHKCFVEVNEEGTEAAAATAVVVGITSAAIEPMPVVFNADHPFVFAIRDLDSGALLFMGRVADPTA